MRGLKSTKTMENKINWERLSHEPDQVILFILNRALDHLNIGYRVGSSHGSNFR